MVFERLLLAADRASTVGAENLHVSCLGIENPYRLSPGGEILLDLLRQSLREIGWRNDFDGERRSALNAFVQVDFTHSVGRYEGDIRNSHGLGRELEARYRENPAEVSFFDKVSHEVDDIVAHQIMSRHCLGYGDNFPLAELIKNSFHIRELIELLDR